MFCPHLEYHKAGYGEYADPANLSCAMNHFGQQGNETVFDIDDFRAIIVRAEGCPDYAGPNA